MSESMEPEIATHQLVLGEYIPEEEVLEVGEIYAYQRDGVMGQEIIIHRLIAAGCGAGGQGKYRVLDHKVL